MRTTDEIHASSERLLSDLKAIVQDGEELLEASAKDLTQKGAAARERLSAALEVAKETRRKLQAQAASGIEATGRLVCAHPYRSIGFALGIGFVVGMLLKRR